MSEGEGAGVVRLQLDRVEMLEGLGEESRTRSGLLMGLGAGSLSDNHADLRTLQVQFCQPPPPRCRREQIHLDTFYPIIGGFSNQNQAHRSTCSQGGSN